MKTEEFKRLLTDIDDKYVDGIGEELEEFRKSKYGQPIIKVSSEFNWKQMVGAAACTAAVFVGIFVFMMNTGIISINISPASSAGSYTSADPESEPAYSDFIPGPDSYKKFSGELTNRDAYYNFTYGLYLYRNFSGELIVDCAYAYYMNSAMPTRYRVGDKFCDIAEVSSAKSTFMITDGNPVLLKQEITLDFIYSSSIIGSDLMSDAWFNKLGLPGFGGDIKILPLMHTVSNEIVNASNGRPNADNWYSVNSISFVVDYVEKTLTPQSDDEIQ